MGDWIDLDSFLPTIKDATRAQHPVAWVAWLFGLLAVALGAVPPVHWPLLAIGVVLLVGAAVHLARRVRDRGEDRRLAQRPPIDGPARVERPTPAVRLRVDVPERDAPPAP